MDPAPGTLLVAHPMLTDPNFRRGVVLLCQHEPESGSFGLVLNRRLPHPMNEAIVGFDAFDTELFQGGPVQPETLHVLHRNGSLIEGSVRVADDVYWGGDPEMIRLAVETGLAPLESFRFYIGYAGWGDEQLRSELEEEAWFLHGVRAAHLFDENPDRLWRVVLREMGGEYAVLSTFPDDPRLN